MGNCSGSSRFLQVQRIICIYDSYAKFISPVVKIYLAVLAIASSFTENCVWLRVAWHELDEYETKLNNYTECRIFPYKRVSLKKYSYCDSSKNEAWISLHEMRQGSHILGSYPQKTRLGSLCKLCAMWIDAPLDRDCCFGEATLSWFVSALPKEIIRSPTEICRLLKRF